MGLRVRDSSDSSAVNRRAGSRQLGPRTQLLPGGPAGGPRFCWVGPKIGVGIRIYGRSQGCVGL